GRGVGGRGAGEAGGDKNETFKPLSFVVEYLSLVVEYMSFVDEYLSFVAENMSFVVEQKKNDS
ncbi:MAG: hypothetical protein RMX65_034195, partial [Nostoc sp. DedQUE01]|nr:hypothetical protein [Nostoc sp. DedQUE01]